MYESISICRIAQLPIWTFLFLLLLVLVLLLLILCAAPYWGRCATSVPTFCLSFETRGTVTASLALRGYFSIEDMVYASSFRQYLLLPPQDAQDGCILLVGDAGAPSCTLKQPLLIWCELSLHATNKSQRWLPHNREQTHTMYEVPERIVEKARAHANPG